MMISNRRSPQHLAGSEMHPIIAPPSGMDHSADGAGRLPSFQQRKPGCGGDGQRRQADNVRSGWQPQCHAFDGANADAHTGKAAGASGHSQCRQLCGRKIELGEELLRRHQQVLGLTTLGFPGQFSQ